MSTKTEVVRVRKFARLEGGYDKLISRIQTTKRLNFISTVMVLTLLVAFFEPAFLVVGIMGLGLKLYVHLFRGVPMQYELDEEFSETYNGIGEAWMELNRNSKFWQISAESARDLKVSGGAGRGVTRVPARATRKAPYYLKTNVKPFGLQLREKQLIFLPDILLVVSKLHVGALPYEEVDVEFLTTEFVEPLGVPKDAHVVDETWVKVNLDGTKDKRYGSNSKVPVCEYGKVVIRSGEGLYVEVMCSDSETIERIREYAEDMFE